MTLWEAAQALPMAVWIPIALQMALPLAGGVAWRLHRPRGQLRIATLYTVRFGVVAWLLLSLMSGTGVLYAVLMGLEGLLPAAIDVVAGHRAAIDASWKRREDLAPVAERLNAVAAVSGSVRVALVGPLACGDEATSCPGFSVRGMSAELARPLLARMTARPPGVPYGVAHDADGALVLARSALRSADGVPDGLFVIALDARAVTQRAQRMAWELLAGTLLLVSLAMWGAARALELSLTRRVEQLIQALDGTAEGAPSEDARNELARLASRVDAAAARAVALEGEVRDAREREIVGRIAGGMAHEFNNLMSVVIGRADLAGTSIPVDAPARHDLAEIKRAGQRGATLTSQLLQASGRQFSQRQALELGTFVERLVPEIQRVAGAEVRVTYEGPGDPLPIVADGKHLTQVVLELVLNARRAMSTGGSLHLHAWRVTLTAPYTGPAHQRLSPGAYARLDVQDSGAGIAPEVLPHVFDPFFSTQGLALAPGLGLAAARGVLVLHDGLIEVSSPPSGGTLVTIYLPIREP